MKKRLRALALCTMVTVSAVSIAACGSSGSSSSTTAAQTSGTSTTAAASGTSTTAAASGETEGESSAETSSGDSDLAAQAEEGMETSISCDPITLSLGCSGTVDGTVMGDAIYSGIEAASRWTNGNFQVTFYPGGQLGGDAELISGMQMGSVDMYTGAPTSQVTVIPELAVMDIGGLYTDTDSCNKVLEQFQSEMDGYYQNAGLHLMALYAPDFRILTSNKPIETADDLKGLNIRTQENEYHMAFWKELGCNPTPLAFGELYIALQQGMMDAQENPWASIVGAKLNEVQKYIIKTNHIPFVSTYVISKTKYDSMTADQQKVCDQFVEYVKRYQMAGTAADDERMEKVCTDMGCEVSDVSDDILALYPDATQAVIDLMKTKVDPDLVDKYVETAKSVQ